MTWLTLGWHAHAKQAQAQAADMDVMSRGVPRTDSSMLFLFSNSMQPFGVHDTYLGSRPRMARQPMLRG